MNAFKKIKDSILIERIRSGSQDAYAIIYDQYHQQIYRFILFKVSSRQVAEDITADVFLKTWEYITGSDKTIENIQALLYSIARNAVIDYYRTKSEHYGLDDTIQAVDQKSEDHTHEIDVKQDVNQLVNQMSKLSDEYNEIITLHYVEDFSIREVAEILGKTENNVRVTLHRALKSLKKIVEDNESTD